MRVVDVELEGDVFALTLFVAVLAAAADAHPHADAHGLEPFDLEGVMHARIGSRTPGAGLLEQLHLCHVRDGRRRVAGASTAFGPVAVLELGLLHVG